ncbi:MAG: YqaA family protein [Pyrinomonadaceae bacterium]
MKLLLEKLTKSLSKLSDFLVAFGPLGLFAVAILDSSFVPLPSSADALMILLTTARPRWMVLYAFVATAGSALGCLLLYYASRRAGRRALAKFSEAKQKRVKELIDRYDVLSVLVASVLPPPFPFKMFVITAGVFRFSLTRFLVAIVVGRGFRFLLEGYFAIRYGAQAKVFLARYYPWIGLGLAIWIIAGFIVRSLFKRRVESVAESGLEAGN